MLALLVMFLPVLYLGFSKRLIIYGLFFSVISESFGGLDLGTLAVPFLFTAAVICLAQKFFDMKYAHDAGFNLSRSVFLALIMVPFIYTFSFFYKWGGIIGISIYRNINISSVSSVVGLTIILEALALVFVFNVVFNKKSDYL